VGRAGPRRCDARGARVTTTAVPAVLASGAAIAAVMGVRRIDLGRSITRVAAGRGIIARSKRGASLSASLGRAGVTLGADAFLALTLFSACLIGAAAWAVVHTPVVAVIAAGSVVAAAWGLVASADRRYLDRFSSELPVVAQQLASAIGAGLSLRQAITRAGIDAPEPAASELRKLATDLEFGARIELALEGAVARLPDPGLRIMVIAILVQRVVGGNLAGALTDLSVRLEERAALEREARSATAQARMSAWLVAGLPLAGGVLVEIAAPGTLARTLGHGPGLVLLIAATALQIAGVALIRRIVNPKYVSR